MEFPRFAVNCVPNCIKKWHEEAEIGVHFLVVKAVVSASYNQAKTKEFNIDLDTFSQAQIKPDKARY